MKFFLVIALLISLSTAIPLANEASHDGFLSNCKNVMEGNGLTSTFPAITAHVLHSLTLQDIRCYFEPYASNDIMIPTINTDASSDDPILFEVVDSPNKNEFTTIGMKVLDTVLSHMDDENYEIKGYNPLEKVAHDLHMHEQWKKVSDAYKILKENPPTDKKFCHCVLDIEENGVLQHLRYLALILREPKLMFGRDNGYIPFEIGYIPFITYAIPSDNYFETDDMARNPVGGPHLHTSADWKVWKQSLKKNAVYVDKHYEAASFLYCAMK